LEATLGICDPMPLHPASIPKVIVATAAHWTNEVFILTIAPYCKNLSVCYYSSNFKSAALR
jgi:hypothetical protein